LRFLQGIIVYIFQDDLYPSCWSCSIDSIFYRPSWLAQEFLISQFELRRRQTMQHLYRLWHDEEGQDIAEYAVMLAVILVIVVGTIRLIGTNSNTVFSNVASSIQ
jgi:Flp pilus assembly pilin Flp